MLVPFGAAVIFKPSPTKGIVDKPLPAALQGMFLGYRVALGGTWNGEYLVESLECFADVDFSYSAVGHSKVLSPHVTKQIRLPRDGDAEFALTAHVGKVNFTLEGVRGEHPKEFTVLEDIYGNDLELGPSVGETLRASHESSPREAETTRVVPVGETPRGTEPYDFGYDSMGRPYPRGSHGHRIVAGSRRTPGVPPQVWRQMSATDKAKVVGPVGLGGAASFGDVAGIAPAGADSDADLLLDCAQSVQDWFDGVHEFSHCGAVAHSRGNPSEHREKDLCSSLQPQCADTLRRRR